MNGENKRKKGSGGWAIIAIILGVVLSALDDLGGAEAIGFVVVVVIVLVIAAVFRLVFKSIKNAAESGTDSPGGAPVDSRPLRREPLEDRPARSRRDAEEDRPSLFRREPLEDRPISRAQRELLPMDEYERRKRIAQLDGFLKNGIVDKEEYKKLRARYEK